MKRSISFALIFVTALASGVSAQARAQGTTKPNPNALANASARSAPSLTLSNNPVTRAVHKVVAAIGFGDAEPERVATPTPRRVTAANNPNAQSTSRPVSTRSVKPNASRDASPASATTPTTTPAKPAEGPRKGALPLPSPAADTAPKVLINREVFQYEGSGRRDPFVSLLNTSELKPLLNDLKLVGVAYDPRGQNSVAVLRDVTSKEQYKVKVGQTLGRMRVAAIQPKAVIFTIEEFGYSRQELLPIAPPDSSKMRPRQ
jgi:hypothetical protein